MPHWAQTAQYGRKWLDAIIVCLIFIPSGTLRKTGKQYRLTPAWDQPPLRYSR
jgi:hypothetical protein